jgi:hypothetical protein
MKIGVILWVLWVALWLGFALWAIMWMYQVAELEKEKAKLGPSVLTVLTTFYTK